jgi:hypothetical protein
MVGEKGPLVCMQYVSAANPLLPKSDFIQGNAPPGYEMSLTEVLAMIPGLATLELAQAA